MMDQQSTKSEDDLMKRRNSFSKSIERDFCDDLLYQQHPQHVDHPRTQLLNEGQRRSVENERSYVPRRVNHTFGCQKSSIEVSDISCQLLKQRSTPDKDIDVFDGNPLNFKYFMTLFREGVESKIEDITKSNTRSLSIF